MQTGIQANYSDLTLLSIPLSEISKGGYGPTLFTDDPIFQLVQWNIGGLDIHIQLDFVGLDLGTMPSNPKPLEILTCFRGLSAELQSLAEKKGLALYWKTPAAWTVHISRQIMAGSRHTLLPWHAPPPPTAA